LDEGAPETPTGRLLSKVMHRAARACYNNHGDDDASNRAAKSRNKNDSEDEKTSMACG